MRSFTKILTAFLMISLFFASCKKDINEQTSSEFKIAAEYDYTIVHEWNDLWLEIERYATGYRPCPTANALGYIGLANYEATINGLPEYRSLADNYNGLSIPKAFNNQEYHWPTVVNAVNNYLYSRLLP